MVTTGQHKMNKTDKQKAKQKAAKITRAADAKDGKKGTANQAAAAVIAHSRTTRSGIQTVTPGTHNKRPAGHNTGGKSLSYATVANSPPRKDGEAPPKSPEKIEPPANKRVDLKSTPSRLETNQGTPTISALTIQDTEGTLPTPPNSTNRTTGPSKEGALPQKSPAPRDDRETEETVALSQETQQAQQGSHQTATGETDDEDAHSSAATTTTEDSTAKRKDKHKARFQTEQEDQTPENTEESRKITLKVNTKAPVTLQWPRINSLEGHDSLVPFTTADIKISASCSKLSDAIRLLEHTNPSHQLGDPKLWDKDTILTVAQNALKSNTSTNAFYLQDSAKNGEPNQQSIGRLMA